MDNGHERELIRRGLAFIGSDAPTAPGFDEVSGEPPRRAARIFAFAFVVVLVGVGGLFFLASRDGGTRDATSAGVIAQVDAVDPSCNDMRDPILLANLFEFGYPWIEVPSGQLATLEVDRVSVGSQEMVVVEALGNRADEVFWDGGKSRGIDVTESWLRSAQIEIRDERFQALQVTAQVGGPVYGQVYPLRNDQAAESALAWVDDAGGVHFLGGCAPLFWTETLRLFAADIGWSDTEEALLLGMINGGPELNALYEWTFGPAELVWDDRAPKDRSVFDDDMPQSLAEELQFGTLQVSIPPTWRDTNTLLCTFIPKTAWNPCVPLTAAAVPEPDVEIDVYSLPGEALQLWLMDNDDQNNRVRIGSVSLTETDELIAIELVDPAPAVRDETGALIAPGEVQWFRRVR